MVSSTVTDDSVEVLPKVFYTQHVSTQYFWKCSEMKSNTRPFYFQHLFSSSSKDVLASPLSKRTYVTD